MSKMFFKMSVSLLAVVGLAWPAAAVDAGRVGLHGHVPAVVAHLSATGRLAATNSLHLAISLPLHNQVVLGALASQMYDPSSQLYHHFLTPEEFTAQFGPTPEDYQAVIDFAKSNGLTVTRTHANRMLVEVNGKVSDIEHAFRINLRTYQHPTENRQFFSPDTEPSVPASLPVLEVGGLSSYSRPHTKLHLHGNSGALPKNGSGPGGNYMGSDYRNAYVPGTTLTGAGQSVALVQFDGYLASDIALYEQQASLPSVTLTNILLNGFNGLPTGSGGEVEVSLDIENVISMAPGLTRVLLYEGDPYNFIPNVVLNQIAVDNAARQISCSWGWGGGPNGTSDQIFQEMILQGQSFFNASGDSDAFLPGEVDDPNGFGYPSCSPYITQVGGTQLKTGAGASFISEQVWNDRTPNPNGGDWGSCGGVSSFYSTPTWQQGFATAANHGSYTGRNIPDVALTAFNVYVIADGGTEYPGTEGTSCAAPLWAGFTALVNQQAAINGKPSVGFINPAIYALANTGSYNNVFNDVTNGNNFWPQSPTNFPATLGYDLCTGLGTPHGTNLIYALASGSSVPNTPVISAPKPYWGNTLSVMNGGNPNGAWFLFVQDDKVRDIGVISNGWAIALTTANPVANAADEAISVLPTNQLMSLAINTHWTLSLAVTNYGPSPSTNVYVSDNLPAGLTLLSSNLTAGSITQFGPLLIWTIGDLPKDIGAALTLNFQATSLGLCTNTAVVSATTTDPNPDDDTVNSVFNVQAAAPPTLSVGAYGPGGFQFTITGAPPEWTTIQGSTNLINWVNLYSGLPTFIYTDPAATNYPHRFYRAVLGP